MFPNVPGSKPKDTFHAQRQQIEFVKESGQIAGRQLKVSGVRAALESESWLGKLSSLLAELRPRALKPSRASLKALRFVNVTNG